MKGQNSVILLYLYKTMVSSGSTYLASIMNLTLTVIESECTFQDFFHINA